MSKGRYLYGMRLRAAAPGAQPKGLDTWTEDVSGKYWSIIYYLRPLTEEECKAYDLDYLGREDDLDRIEHNYYDDKE